MDQVASPERTGASSSSSNRCVCVSDPHAPQVCLLLLFIVKVSVILESNLEVNPRIVASRSDEPPVGADVWRRGRAPPRGRARPPELHQNRGPDGRSRAAREPERVGTWRGPDGE